MFSGGTRIKTVQNETGLTAAGLTAEPSAF